MLLGRGFLLDVWNQLYQTCRCNIDQDSEVNKMQVFQRIFWTQAINCLRKEVLSKIAQLLRFIAKISGWPV